MDAVFLQKSEKMLPKSEKPMYNGMYTHKRSV